MTTLTKSMQTLTRPNELLQQLAAQLKQILLEKKIEQPLMVGIHTGGVWIAQQLHHILQLDEPLATLDISFYRDDFSRIGIHPQVKPSQLPPQVENRHIILVDDVLHTGRTIRAAMNEIFDYGRPASITLACLLERSGRELPIQADAVAQHLHLEASQHIKLTGPTPLKFDLQII